MPQLHILSERVLDDDMVVYSIVDGVYICGRDGPFGVCADDAFYYADIDVKNLVNCFRCHYWNGRGFYAKVNQRMQVSVECPGEGIVLNATLSSPWIGYGDMAFHDMISDETSTTGTLLRYGLIVHVRIDWL